MFTRQLEKVTRPWRVGEWISRALIITTFQLNISFYVCKIIIYKKKSNMYYV